MLTRLRAYVKGLLRREAIDGEVDEELRFHVEMETQANIDRGMAPVEARRVALRDIGGVTQTRETTREVRSIWFDLLGRDVRFAARSLRRAPAFSLTVVLTLALIIGATTALFAAMYGLVVRRLPYPDPGRLVVLWDSNLKTGEGHLPLMESAFAAFESGARSFSGMAAYTRPSAKNDMFAVSIWGTEERISRAQCSHQLFSVLDVTPVLGRLFTAEDAAPDSAAVAILSYQFWQRRYGSRPDVVGQVLSVNFAGDRHDYTIVGVAPETLEFPFPLVPEKADVWVNLRLSPRGFVASNNLNVVARLRKGVSVQVAQNEVDALNSRIERDHPRYYEGERTTVVSLQSELTRDVRTILWILVAAVGCVVLIGGANVGHLFLARAATRQRDYALRAALGAGRAALVRAAFTEVALLATLGGVLGLILANGVTRLFLALLPGSLYIPRIDVVVLDSRLLLGAALGSVATITCLGILPALRVLRPGLNPLIRSGIRADGRAPSVFRRSGSLLLVSEMGLTLVLLAATAMLTGSLRALLETNGRFQPERLLTLDISLSNAAVQSLKDFQAVKATLFPDLEERVRAMPGVRAVAAAESFPLANTQVSFRLDGGASPAAGALPKAELHLVTPNFFETMGVTIARGRPFAASDDSHGPMVALINEAMARRYWPGSDPIGQRIGSMRYTDHWVHYQVVGIIKEPDRFGRGDPARPALYLSQRQVPIGHLSLIVRTTGDPSPLRLLVRQAALQVAPGYMLVSDVRAGDEIVSETSARLHFASMVLTALTTVALLLAAIGIYGQLSYASAQRTHELGVRLALGATPSGILRLVLWQGMSLAVTGVLAGCAVAIPFSDSMASVLYHLAPAKFATLAGAGGFLLVVAFLACYIPAHRAAGLDPVEVLRAE